MSIMNMKWMQLVSGLAGILAVLNLDLTLAAGGELRVEYEDKRLTVAASAVEAGKLLEAVTARAGVRLNLIQYPSAPPILSLSFENVEVDQGIQRILDALRHQAPVSYVLLYEGNGEEALEGVVLMFGEGVNSPFMAKVEPRPERPTSTPSGRIPQSLSEIESKLPAPIRERLRRLQTSQIPQSPLSEIESKLPAPIRERLRSLQKGSGEVPSLIEGRRKDDAAATR